VPAEDSVEVPNEDSTVEVPNENSTVEVPSDNTTVEVPNEDSTVNITRRLKGHSHYASFDGYMLRVDSSDDDEATVAPSFIRYSERRVGSNFDTQYYYPPALAVSCAAVCGVPGYDGCSEYDAYYPSGVETPQGLMVCLPEAELRQYCSDHVDTCAGIEVHPSKKVGFLISNANVLPQGALLTAASVIHTGWFVEMLPSWEYPSRTGMPGSSLFGPLHTADHGRWRICACTGATQAGQHAQMCRDKDPRAFTLELGIVSTTQIGCGLTIPREPGASEQLRAKQCTEVPTNVSGESNYVVCSSGSLQPQPEPEPAATVSTDPHDLYLNVDAEF
jgi:hypothetical protein